MYEMAQLLDITPGRLQQWEAGDGCRVDRIRAWAMDQKKPQWIRDMARRMIRTEIVNLQSTLKDRVSQ